MCVCLCVCMCLCLCELFIAAVIFHCDCACDFAIEGWEGMVLGLAGAWII